jgi:tricarballylate dehydrogenase
VLPKRQSIKREQHNEPRCLHLRLRHRIQAWHAAHEAGARVKPESGGNSRFTAGAIRFAYRGVDDLREIMPDLSQEEIDRTDFGTYTEDQFFDDMFRVTRFRTDPTLCELLVRRSFDAMKWLRSKGRAVPTDLWASSL